LAGRGKGEGGGERGKRAEGSVLWEVHGWGGSGGDGGRGWVQVEEGEE